MRRGCIRGSRAGTPDCWLQFNMHPEAPASAQFGQRFAVVFVCPRTNAELVPKFHAAIPTLAHNFSSPIGSLSTLTFRI